MLKSLAILGTLLIVVGVLQMIFLPMLLSDEMQLPYTDLWSITIILFSAGIVFLILASIIRIIRNKRARGKTAREIQELQDTVEKLEKDKED